MIVSWLALEKVRLVSISVVVLASFFAVGSKTSDAMFRGSFYVET